MPFSTLRAVRTPGRARPSSTRVMATAGRMPTTTVSASSTRAIAAMLPSMRPMKESTTSRAEMSMRTARARALTMRSARSSCSVMASRSCMSTCTVTRRYSPILRIGMRSMAASGRALRRAGDGEAVALQRHGEGAGQRGLARHVAQLHSQVHDGLRDLRTDPADQAVRSHESGRGHRLQEMLGDQGVHRGHARDVNDGDGGARLHDACEEGFHDELGPLAVERADQGQGENALPQLDDRGGELEHAALLAGDDSLAALLVDLRGVEAELVEEHGQGPQLGGEGGSVLGELALQPGEDGFLQREDERRRLRGGEPWRARDWETESRKSRTSCQAAPLMSATSAPVRRVWARFCKSARDCSWSSAFCIRSGREVTALICACTQSWRI